jgi:hypothetical protein
MLLSISAIDFGAVRFVTTPKSFSSNKSRAFLAFLLSYDSLSELLN